VAIALFTQEHNIKAGTTKLCFNSCPFLAESTFLLHPFQPLKLESYPTIMLVSYKYCIKACDFLTTYRLQKLKSAISTTNVVVFLFFRKSAHNCIGKDNISMSILTTCSISIFCIDYMCLSTSCCTIVLTCHLYPCHSSSASVLLRSLDLLCYYMNTLLVKIMLISARLIYCSRGKNYL